MTELPLFRRSGRFRVLFTCVAAGLGCSGASPSGGNSGGSSGGGGDVVDDAPTTPAECKVEGGFGRDPMRRLTQAEFDYTVQDLLGASRGEGRDLLPGDEITAGYMNNAVITLQVSQAESYQIAARRIAERAVERLDDLLACDGGDEAQCAHAFIERFGRKALRRPLDGEERDAFFKLYDDKREQADHKQGIRLFVEAILQYPSFMYRPVVGAETPEPGVRKLTGYEIATRLSYFLWSSTPDDQLLDAAEAGDLDSVSGVRDQVFRMMEDPKFERALSSFVLQWLDMREEPPAKNADEFPDFSEEVWQSARASVARFFADAVQNGGDMATLMTGPVAFVDQRLAKIYDVSVSGDELKRFDMDSNKRGGVMTQAGVMQVLGTSAISRPIKRGLFVRNRLFCQDPPPVPVEGVPPFEASKEGLTLREQLEEHRANPVCAGCHAFFDPIGLAFEHYDGMGVYREEQHGKTIDASGELFDTDVDGKFNSALELMSLLEDSQMVQRCLSSQIFRFAIGRLDGDADRCALDDVVKTFRDKDQSLPEMFAAIATSDPFRFTGSP